MQFQPIVILTFALIQAIDLTSSIDNYTAKEREALKILLPAVKKSLYLNYQHEDKYLIRWLRHKSLDIPKTKEALEKSLSFRRDNSIDALPASAEMAQLQQQLSTNFGSAVDKAGNPACLMTFSKWDIRKVMLSGQQEKMRRYPFFVFESMTSLMRQMNVSTWILINDLAGFSLRQHGCLACLPFYADVVNTYENHYPNSAKYMVAINVPRIFDTPLKLMLSLMSPETKKVFKVFGGDKSEWQKFLLEHFDADQLIRQHGGTKSAYPPPKPI